MKNVVEAFIEKNGSVGDWGGDQAGWLQALGAFTQGWDAHIEAVEQCVHPTDGTFSSKSGLLPADNTPAYNPNLGKTISG